MSSLANSWVAQGNEVTLLTFDDGETSAYPISPGIKRSGLTTSADSRHLLQAFFRNIKRVFVLRRCIKKSNPDVVISSMDVTNVITLLATTWMRVPIVVCEHIDPSRHEIGAIWNRMRRALYPFADAVVCLTDAMLVRFEKMARIKGYVIPNPLTIPGTFPAKHLPLERKGGTEYLVVAMGRLVWQKGFDMLLDAFSRVADRHPQWSLQILGTGPLLEELRSQARALHLLNKVDFKGEVADPFPILRNADLFVFSSRFEGFGLALGEAMSCGVPVVSFDCPSGPSAIIRDGVDGVLVPPENVDALAAVLDRLMSDEQERQKLAACAPQVLERFGEAKILAMWQQLFDGLLQVK